MAKQSTVDHLLKKWSVVQVLEKWRRARDSNPQGPRGPVDFKFEPPLRSPRRHRASSLLIAHLRGLLAGLKVRCRPMTHDGEGQEMAKQRRPK